MRIADEISADTMCDAGFDPPFSTLTIGADSAAAFITAAALDAAVVTNSSTIITTVLGSSGTIPPSANVLARYNTAAGREFIQTRPTGNIYTLLLSTLVNNTFSNVTSVTISYDYGTWPLVAEEVRRVCGALRELPERWQALPVGQSLTLPWPAVRDSKR